jgi:hypothetical protein
MVKEKEPLKARTKRWKKVMLDAATGPLIIAGEVVELANEWENHRDGAGGIDCTTWLRTVFGRGKGLGWFRHRHEAVVQLGEAIRRTIHHDVAIWVMNQVPQNLQKKVVKMLTLECRDNGNNPITYQIAIPLIREQTGKAIKQRKRTCKRCTYLEGLLEKNMIKFSLQIPD